MIAQKSVALTVLGMFILSGIFGLASCESSDSELGISLTGLQEGDEVWGIVKIVIKVSGDDTSNVKLYYDTVDDNHIIGSPIKESGSKYALDWHTQDLPNGQTTIYAVVSDSNGELMQDFVSVRIKNLTRSDSIPPRASKLTPLIDPAPPQLMPEFKSYWHDPIPLEGPINTAGAEGSPFITPDGNTFYFWFKGDVTKTVHEEVEDPVGGIYWSEKVHGLWQEPEKLNLQYFDQLSLDGAHTVRDDKLWFVSIREGNVGGEWQEPEPIDIVNTEMNEGWPYVSEDGTELWFTRATPGPEIFRSLKVNGKWQEPEKIIGPMAGEPTLDDEGNIYFTHHWWNSEENRANEADFYVCYRK